MLLVMFLASCAPAVSVATDEEINSTLSSTTPTSELTALPEELTPKTSTTEENSALPGDNPYDPLSDLYDCQMRLRFTSGPLENQKVNFTVLGEDYFADKSNKFDPGKGTSIYYEPQRYLIVHSSYVNGNILRPMEAEFLRKYLEHWGQTGTDYIQGQIGSLLGSEVYWTCDDGLILTSEITGVVRLSHEASQRLWLEPENLAEILRSKEGLSSEWVGEIDRLNDESIYIGFCGWGPEATANSRYTYYRYLVQFSPVK